MTATDPDAQSAYRYCRRLAKAHYENFPVASWLLPKKLRNPIAAIYVFAREADDIADEGDATAAERLEQLDTFQQQLHAVAEQQSSTNAPQWVALGDTIQQFGLDATLFEDLLQAFRQDVTKTRYADLPALLEYCGYSANPVGRLILQLNNSASETQLQQSDAICTSLQLINFFQDISQDYHENNRIYLPQDALKNAGISESQLLNASPQQLSQVLRPLYRYTVQLMQQGAHLGLSLNGRLGWEVRAMTLGGMETLFRLMQQSDNELLSRPRLSGRQHLSVVLNAVSKRRYWARTQALS